MEQERFDELAAKALVGELPDGFGVQEVASVLGRLADRIDGEEIDAEGSTTIADILTSCEQILCTASIHGGEDMDLAEASVEAIRNRDRETVERWIRQRSGLSDTCAIKEVLVGQEAVAALNEEGAIYALVELAQDSMVGVTRTADGELRPFRTIDVATGLDTTEMLDEIT